MAKEPERRYATANELAIDLERFCANRPILARRPTIRGRLAAWSRRHRRATSTAAAAVLIAALVSAVGMTLLWKEQRRTKAALVRLETARTGERQALLFAFKASDQVAGRALHRMAGLAKGSPEAERDREFCRTALDYYEKIARVDPTDAVMRTISAAAYHRIGFIRMVLAQANAEEPCAARSSSTAA